MKIALTLYEGIRLFEVSSLLIAEPIASLIA